MICMHVKRSSAIKYVSLACQKFFNYALTPTQDERECKREGKSEVRESLRLFWFALKSRQRFLFSREAAEKWQATHTHRETQTDRHDLALRAYCACHCDSQFVMVGSVPCHMWACSSCYAHLPSIPLSVTPPTSPQSAWHIPHWCAFNCSKILKQFLSLSLFLHLLCFCLSAVNASLKQSYINFWFAQQRMWQIHPQPAYLPVWDAYIISS